MIALNVDSDSIGSRFRCRLLASKDAAFVSCSPSDSISQLKETKRFKKFPYDEIVARASAVRDILWLRHESLEDTDNLHAAENIVTEIVEDVSAALRVIETLAESLGAGDSEVPARRETPYVPLSSGLIRMPAA